MIDLPDVIELQVTQEDIDSAITECKDLCRECVVGRALNRQIPQYFGYAFNGSVGFYDAPKRHKYYKKYKLCSVGKNVVSKFNAFDNEKYLRDNTKPDIKPCVITLTALQD